jgi:hypothetical protein
MWTITIYRYEMKRRTRTTKEGKYGVRTGDNGKGCVFEHHHHLLTTITMFVYFPLLYSFFSASFSSHSPYSLLNFYFTPCHRSIHHQILSLFFYEVVW